MKSDPMTGEKMKIIVNSETGKVHVPGCGHLGKAKGELVARVGKRADATVAAAKVIGMLCQVCEKKMAG
jgi:hypothetical protein